MQRSECRCCLDVQRSGRKANLAYHCTAYRLSPSGWLTFSSVATFSRTRYRRLHTDNRRHTYPRCVYTHTHTLVLGHASLQRFHYRDATHWGRFRADTWPLSHSRGNEQLETPYRGSHLSSSLALATAGPVAAWSATTHLFHSECTVCSMLPSREETTRLSTYI